MEANLARVMMNAPFWNDKRKPISATDFGDEKTVGLHVKRLGKNIDNFEDHDFGIYLGEYEKKFHIGTCRICSFAPEKLESFSTLEELKQKWTLD